MFVRSSKIDMITVSFYEEWFEDKILLEILNRKSQKKLRGYNLKTMVLEYCKLVNPELVREIENEIKKKEIKDNYDNLNDLLERELLGIDNTSGTPKKKQIKGMESF